MHGFELSRGEVVVFAVVLFGPFVLGGLLWLAAVILRFWFQTTAAVCLLLASLCTLLGCWAFTAGKPLTLILSRAECHSPLLAGMIAILAAVLSAADIVLRRRRVADTKCFVLALPIALAGTLMVAAHGSFFWSWAQLDLFCAIVVLLMAGGMVTAAVALRLRGKRGAWLCSSVAVALICCLAVVVWGNLIVALAGLAQ